MNQQNKGFQNKNTNNAENDESLENFNEIYSVHEYREQNSQLKLPDKKEKISKSDSSIAKNFNYGNRSENNLPNKGYLFERENEERELGMDVRNLSIDEKLSTKKIQNTPPIDYKFFQKKPQENHDYKYEIPENERFERAKASQHKELKKSTPLPIQEKTEENLIEATEASVLRANFESMKGVDFNASKFNSFQPKNLNLKYLKKYSGHKNSVNCMSFDQETKKLWSGSHDYNIKVIFIQILNLLRCFFLQIWDITNSNYFQDINECYFEIKSQSNRWIWSLLYNQWNQIMMSGLADNLIRVEIWGVIY